MFHVELNYENVKELQKTHTVKEMADIFGFSVTTMGRRLASLGLTKPANRTDIKDEEVVKDWDDGLTIVEIAKKYKASHDTITKRLKKYGIECSRVEGIKKHFKREHAEKWSDIKSDLDKGMSVTSVREKHRIRYTKLLELMELNSYRYKSDVLLFDLNDRIDMSEIKSTELFYLKKIKKYYLKYNELPTKHQLADISKRTVDTVSKAVNRYNLNQFVLNFRSSYLVSAIIRELQLLEIEYDLNNRSILVDDGRRLEIDIYLPKYNLGIEVNPVSTHSVDVGKLGLSSKNYHQEKSLLAEEKGIGLIQFYDADYHDARRFEVFKEQLKALVSDKTKIGARSCMVQPISAKDCNEFLNQYHFQGMERSSSIRSGLYYDDILVGVLTLGKSRYTSDEYEIVRYCLDPNVVIIGGFSKLFKHALQDIKVGSKVVSYMDLNKRLRSSNVYENNCFQFDGITRPDYVWVKRYGTETLSRYTTTKSKLIEQGYDASKSEVEIMRERGYFRVFGSGSKRYVYVVS